MQWTSKSLPKHTWPEYPGIHPSIQVREVSETVLSTRFWNSFCIIRLPHTFWIRYIYKDIVFLAPVWTIFFKDCNSWSVWDGQCNCMLRKCRVWSLWLNLIHVAWFSTESEEAWTKFSQKMFTAMLLYRKSHPQCYVMYENCQENMCRVKLSQNVVFISRIKWMIGSITRSIGFLHCIRECMFMQSIPRTFSCIL